MTRVLRVAAVVALLAGIAWDANAQQSSRRRFSAFAVEIEGVGGYTLVDLRNFARPGTVTASEHDLSGAFGRVFLTYAGDVRLGLEAGRQQLFWYDAVGGSAQTHVDIEPWYGGIAVRLPESRRFSFDFGMGMYRFPKNNLAFRDNGLRLSTSFAVYYRLVSYRGVSLPIGARIASILDDRSAVLPAALTAGVAIRPFRGARGR